MRRVDRLWIQALDKAIDQKLVDMLAKLKVFKAEVWRSYMTNSHTKLANHRQDKERRRARSEARSFTSHLMPPRNIKPTKHRKF